MASFLNCSPVWQGAVLLQSSSGNAPSFGEALMATQSQIENYLGESNPGCEALPHAISNPPTPNHVSKLLQWYLEVKTCHQCGNKTYISTPCLVLSSRHKVTALLIGNVWRVNKFCENIFTQVSTCSTRRLQEKWHLDHGGLWASMIRVCRSNSLVNQYSEPKAYNIE